MSKEYIVIDLDGTLCDCAHRVHLAAAKQWDEFHSLCHKDQPFQDLVHIINLAARLDSGYILVAVTGRSEKFRKMTYDWLAKYGLLHKIDKLLMRPDDNFEKDGQMKLGLLKIEGINPEDIAFALDDRETVVAAFREAGIACYQVRVGSY